MLRARPSTSRPKSLLLLSTFCPVDFDPIFARLLAHFEIPYEVPARRIFGDFYCIFLFGAAFLPHLRGGPATPMPRFLDDRHPRDLCIMPAPFYFFGLSTQMILFPPPPT